MSAESGVAGADHLPIADVAWPGEDHLVDPGHEPDGGRIRWGHLPAEPHTERMQLIDGCLQLLLGEETQRCPVRQGGPAAGR